LLTLEVFNLNEGIFCVSLLSQLSSSGALLILLKLYRGGFLVIAVRIIVRLQI
jgi:hypothetical protein